MKKRKPADIEVTGTGSTFAMIRPLTAAGLEWINASISYESWQVSGGALAVDHRYIDDLVAGMIDDGLRVS